MATDPHMSGTIKQREAPILRPCILAGFGSVPVDFGYHSVVVVWRRRGDKPVPSLSPTLILILTKTRDSDFNLLIAIH
jgi:hypothetical protein